MDVTFYGCSSLKSINLNNFDTSHVTNMYGVFFNCYSLESISIDNFDVSSVTDMTGMFCNCQSLTELNLNNFNTKNAKLMTSMFFGCSSLISLDLSSFRTSNVIKMNSMFTNCYSITSINLSSFDTSSVTLMGAMFSNCYKLKSLNLNNFKTTLANSIYSMFRNCYSLTDLEMQSFDTASVTNMFGMFINCTSLTTLNLSNFDTSSLTNKTNMFDGCNNTLLYCIINKDNTIQNKILQVLTGNSFNNNNCSQLCFYKNKKYIFEKEQYVINCYDDDIYKFEYENICYKSCPNGTQNSLDYEYLCIKENQTIISSTIIEDISTTEFINKNDISSSIYSYSENYIIPTTIKYLNNTYNTNNTFYINNTNNTNISINIDINYFKYLCKINDNSTTKDDIIKKIRKEIKNGNLEQLINFFIKENKDDLLAEENGIKYQITSTYNQNNKEYINISTVILGECEPMLRLHYNISNDTDLLIFKIDIFEEGLLFFFNQFFFILSFLNGLIPIIEYEVYNSKTREKLELEICKDIKIDLSFPVYIDENNLFKYNLSSEYYNNICYPYTTEYKTDITLNDRKKEFNEKNMSLCENNYEYNDYNFTTKKVKCECLIKNKFPLISELSINKDKLIKKFFEFKNIMNICIIKCYKRVFCKEGIISNIGSYIILTIIVVTIILTIIFK